MNNNASGKDTEGKVDPGKAPVMDVSGIVQNLANSMMREAMDLTAKIKSAAEAEAARLVEGAESRARETEARAQAALEAATSEADGMRREAREETARLRSAAEAEAARLVEGAGSRARETEARAQRDLEAAAKEKESASLALQEARQKAIAIEAEVTKEAAQVRFRLKEDIDSHLAGVLEKVRKELRPSLDYLVNKARVLEEEFNACGAPRAVGEVAALDETLLASPPEGHEPARELHSGLGEAIGDVEASSVGTPSSDVDGDAESRQGGGEDTSEGGQAVPEGQGKMVEGKTEIHVAPPISIAKLLGLTRYLENALHVKVLRTSGSWSLGTVITLSLSDPAPLVSILLKGPNVASAEIVESKVAPSSEQDCFTMIRVALTGSSDPHLAGRGGKGQAAS